MLLLVCGLLSVVLLVCSGLPSKPSNIDVEALRSKWKEYQLAAHDPGREKMVRDALSKAAGIYADGKQEIPKTVLIQVIESHRNDTKADSYRQLLLNFFCYSQQHKLRSVLYVISRSATAFQREKAHYQQFNPLVTVLPYPYELFWATVSQKSSNITLGGGRGDYNSSWPAFTHFGSLPMLVPALEALRLGFDVLYLDVDMVLLQDPLPWLTRGRSDVVLSPELKACRYPSLQYKPHWAAIEPNTGTMLLRSNPRTVSFVQQWLQRIVEENAMNDQKHMHLAQMGRSLWYRDCEADPMQSGVREHDRVLEDGGVSYCMLNEMLFFTGLMEIFCNRGIREGSEAAFYLSMARMSLAQPLHAAQQHSARKPFDLYAFLRADLSQYSHFHHPVAFHVNYCGNKTRCLQDRNLWLLQDDDKCRPFALQQSHYAAIPWAEKLKHSQSALHRALQEELFKDAGNITVSVEDLKQRLEGKMVKFHNAHTVFKVEDGQLRPLIKQTTAQHVMVWHHEMLHLLPIGKEL